MQKENSQNLENNGQTSSTLRKTRDESWMGTPRPIHGQRVREKPNMGGFEEMRGQADRVVETTAKHWEIA
jgi:hypothetical protein